MRPYLDLFDEADAVAIEHVLWAVGQGLTPCQVLEQIRPQMRPVLGADWHLVVGYLAKTWRELQFREALTLAADAAPLRRAA